MLLAGGLAVKRRRTLSRHTAADAALLAGVLVSFILARLLKRITFGLELDEIADLLSEVEDLAIEQAGLQPVATLLATGLATEEVFTAVAEEAGRPVAAGTAQAYRSSPTGRSCG